MKNLNDNLHSLIYLTRNVCFFFNFHIKIIFETWIFKVSEHRTFKLRLFKLFQEFDWEVKDELEKIDFVDIQIFNYKLVKNRYVYHYLSLR